MSESIVFSGVLAGTLMRTGSATYRNLGRGVAILTDSYRCIGVRSRRYQVELLESVCPWKRRRIRRPISQATVGGLNRHSNVAGKNSRAIDGAYPCWRQSKFAPGVLMIYAVDFCTEFPSSRREAKFGSWLPNSSREGVDDLRMALEGRMLARRRGQAYKPPNF